MATLLHRSSSSCNYQLAQGARNVAKTISFGKAVVVAIVITIAVITAVTYNFVMVI